MILGLLAFIAIFAAVEGWSQDDYILELNENNYLSVLSKMKRTVVLLYDGECTTHHCLHSMYNFREAVREAIQYDLSKVDRHVHYAIADLSRLKSRTFKKLVKGSLPKVFFFGKKFHIPFFGPLETSRLESWMIGHSQNKLKEVTEADEIENLLRKNEKFVICKSKTYNGKLYIWANSLALEFTNIPFIHAISDEWAHDQGWPKERITLHLQRDKVKKLFTGSSYTELKDWLVANMYNGVTEMNHHVFDDLLKEETPAAMMVCESVYNCTKNVEVFNTSLEEFRSRIIPTYAYLDRLHEIPFLKSFEMTAKLPSVVVVDVRAAEPHYHYLEKEFSYGNIKDFVGHYLSRRLHFQHESEDCFDHGNELVYRVTGHNFKRLILSHRRKSSILLIHSNHSIYSEALLEFEKLALELEEIVKDLRFFTYNQLHNHAPLPIYSSDLHLLFIPNASLAEKTGIELVGVAQASDILELLSRHPYSQELNIKALTNYLSHVADDL